MTKRRLTKEQVAEYRAARLAAMGKTPLRTCVYSAWTKRGQGRVVRIHLQHPRIDRPAPRCGAKGVFDPSVAPVVDCQDCLAWEAHDVWHGRRATEVRAAELALARLLADLGA